MPHYKGSLGAPAHIEYIGKKRKKGRATCSYFGKGWCYKLGQKCYDCGRWKVEAKEREQRKQARKDNWTS